MTTDQVREEVARNRARMDRIRELLERLDPSKAMAFEDFEGDISELLEHARWMHRRLEGQRTLLHRFAVSHADTHRKLEIVHGSLRKEMEEIADGLTLPSERTP